MPEQARNLNILLLGDIVSEHAAPWELLAYARHLDATAEEASRRRMIATIIGKQIREGLVQLAEMRRGEAHALSTSDAIQRLSEPETWDPEQGLLLELRPTELGAQTYYAKGDQEQKS